MRSELKAKEEDRVGACYWFCYWFCSWFCRVLSLLSVLSYHDASAVEILWTNFTDASLVPS